MAAQNEQPQQATGKGDSNYPLYALGDALTFAEAVNALGGARSEVDRSMVASQLNLDEKSASLSQRMGAAKSYGIIKGRGAYSLTSFGIQYFLPNSEADKQLALLSFLGSPAAFMVLVKRFDGSKLPPIPMLGNILHKEANVPVSWKDRVAQIFLKSARTVGVIDGNGFLRIRSAIQALQNRLDVPSENQEQSSPVEDSQVVSAERVVPESRSFASAAGSNLWSFTFEGMSVRVETPKDLKFGLWEKLNGYVGLLKPPESTKS